MEIFFISLPTTLTSGINLIKSNIIQRLQNGKVFRNYERRAILTLGTVTFITVKRTLIAFRNQAMFDIKYQIQFITARSVYFLTLKLNN